MNTLKKFALLCMVGLMFVISGCASVLKKQETTCVIAKVFDEKENERLGKNFEDGQALIQKFLERIDRVKIGVTTYADLKNIGLDPDAVNVSHYPGQTAAAYKWRLGSENLQLQFKNAKESNEFAKEQSKWFVLEYSLYNVREISDRFYFSKKNTEKRGTNLWFIIILSDTSSAPIPSQLTGYDGKKNYLVQQVYLGGEKELERKEMMTAAAGGIFEILDKMREQMQLFMFFYFLQDAFRK